MGKEQLLLFQYRCRYLINFCSPENLKKTSVVDRHRFDADPDPNIHVDADPDPASNWHKNNADSRADLTSSLTHVGKPEYFLFLFIHSIARLHCLSFSSVSIFKCALIFSMFDTILKHMEKS
jgi:hypothetical protein